MWGVAVIAVIGLITPQCEFLHGTEVHFFPGWPCCAPSTRFPSGACVCTQVPACALNVKPSIAIPNPSPSLQQPLKHPISQSRHTRQHARKHAARHARGHEACKDSCQAFEREGGRGRGVSGGDGGGDGDGGIEREGDWHEIRCVQGGTGRASGGLTSSWPLCASSSSLSVSS